MKKKTFSKIFFSRNNLLSLLLLFPVASLFGQTFQGILLNKSDSTTLPYAAIKLAEKGIFTSSNDKGEFTFQIPDDVKELHFEIAFTGCHASISSKVNGNAVTKLYVVCSDNTLQDFVVQGMSAKDIVKKAIANIQINYSDSSYASPSFYRQYEQVNGVFRNLIEAQTIVLFNLSKAKNEIEAKEACAVMQLRRSTYFRVEDFYNEDFPDLMKQNPIYHLNGNSLNPKALDFYDFHFDTLEVADQYIINYICANWSSENHGIDNYNEIDLDGEGSESGTLFIDKNSFAILKYERNVARNKAYNYPKHNNFLQPQMKFTGELVEGKLIVEYEKINGKYYLKTILHSYTNNYFRTQTYQKLYSITDCFEWHSTGVTRVLDNKIMDKFFFSPDLVMGKYVYDKSQWKKEIPEFYFFRKEEVYADLEKFGEIEEQFLKSGK